MRIQHNIAAMNSYRNFSSNTKSVGKNLEKLSSGYRINRAGDDAAGLAISEKMRAQITGLQSAQKNAKDGISLVQTAEGALTEVHSMLNRMFELSEQSANGTYDNDVDRANLQKEVSALKTEVNRIADSSNFNGIKLLDGSLSTKVSDVLGTEAGSVNFSDGMDINSAAGTGEQSKFSISIDKEFSDGDTMTINYNKPLAGGGTTQKSLTLTYTDAAIADYAADDALTFTGNTKDEQIQSIMDRLTHANTSAALDDFMKADNSASLVKTAGAATGEYTASVTGNTMTLEAFDEAKVGSIHLSSITTSNENCSYTKTQDTAGTANSAAVMTAYQNGIEKLVTGDSNIQSGDTLRFKFTLGGGKNASVDLKITADMIDSNHETMTQNIANALADAHFTDDGTTNMDESQLKVSDYMEVHANVEADTGGNVKGAAEIGSLQFIVKDTTQATDAADFKITGLERAVSGSTSFNTMESATTILQTADFTGAVAAGAATEENTIAFDKNFGIGDQFQIEGQMADGRTFKVTLEASKDGSASNSFKKGTDITTSVDNIVAALAAGTTQVEITNRDGSDGGTMTGDKVFLGAGGASGMTFSNDAGDLEITNTNAGLSNTVGLTGSVDFGKTMVTPAGAAAASGIQINEGLDQTNAKMTIDFNDVSKLEYGSAFTIGAGESAKTFELVASDDAETTQDGNIRVVVSDLENASGADVATAAKAAIDSQLKDSTTDTNYSAWAEEIGIGTKGAAHGDKLVSHAAGTSVISLSTADKGSTVEAIDTEATYGVKDNTTISFNKNDDGTLKIQAGDTISINGKTYEFESDIRKVDDGNNMIRVTDFNDAENIAAGIKEALATDDTSVDVKINDNGSVTLSGAGTNDAPKVELGEAESGLNLQIGDTAEDFNKLNVVVSDMHTEALGIDEVDIGTQTGASNAMGAIKDAINSVSSTRGDLGAFQNRLEHTINNLSVMHENIQDAEATIRDVDVAQEMMSYTKNNILVQSAQAMLAQANQAPQGVLQLLG